MRAEIELRPYQDTDRQGVIALWEAAFTDSKAWNAADGVIDRKAAVQPDLFLVAVSGTHVIGTILAGYDGVRGWVHRLAVHNDHKRQGIASALMRQAEAALRTVGCPKINLQVRDSNLEVIAFYETLGYSVEPITSMGKAL